MTGSCWQAPSDVRKWSGDPQESPGVVGRPPRMPGSGREAPWMSANGREALPDVRKWS